jgi:polyhydroxyalkanoate synthesis regulator phasin
MIGNVSQSIRTAHIAPIGMLGNCDYPKFSKDNTERIRERIDVLIFILEIPMKSQTDTNDRLYEQLESYIKAFMDSNTPLRNCNPDQVRDHMITAFKSVCKFLYDLKQKTLADEKMAQLYADVRHLLQDNATQKDRIVAQETEINRLKANVDFLERKISPGSIEYDYDMIQRRIDPIRDELNYTQRVFARLIRNRYSAPVAILVSTAK